MEKLFQNGLDKLQQFTTNPQQAIKDLQETNKVFLENVQNLVKETPEQTQKYLKEQQEIVEQLNKNLYSALKETPADWEKIGKMWFDFQTNQFTSYLNEVKKQNEYFQSLISKTTSATEK